MAENNRAVHPVGHEQRDVSAFAVTASGMATFGLVVVVVFAMWFVFNQLAQQASQATAPPELARERTLPPEPRVEGNPVAAYREIRRGEDQLLDDYAWIDPDKGIVRIPVNRALEVIAKRGLPPAPSAAKPAGSQK